MRRLRDKKRRRLRRKFHIRKRIFGTADRPRISIYRSNRYIYVQVIDDLKGETLAAVSNREADLKGVKSTVAEAEKIGELLGRRMKEKKLLEAAFDRNGFLYHGVVKSVASGIRKAGIKF
jgi:large subunit ribosomal protein L18